MSVRVSVLGATTLEGPVGSVDIAARKHRALLAALVLDLGAVVSADRLVALIWGADAPPGAFGTLHSYVSALRRLLEPGLQPRAKSTVLLTADDGYRLALSRVSVDATAFVDQVRARHRVLDPLASQLATGPNARWPGRAEVEAQVEGLEQALRAWRGTPFTDLAEHPDVLAERSALESLRTTASDDLALGLLALGEHATVLGLTEQSITRDPLRERAWSLHALALARAGRQAEALDAIRRLRRLLHDELGIDPGPEIRDLESALLQQFDAVLTGWLRPRGRMEAPRSSTARPTRAPTHPLPTPPSQSTETGGSPIVGRQRERDAIAQLLADAQGGHPGTVLMIGEAGAGKSRLAEWAITAATTRGMTATLGSCSADDGAPPLLPWRQLLTRLDVPLPPELSTEHERGADSDHDSVAERAFSTHAAIARALRGAAAAAGGGGLLVVLDDLHWADSPTLRCLAHVVSSLEPGDRLAVVTTRRPVVHTGSDLAGLEATLARHGARSLELEGLAFEEAYDLVTSILGGLADSEAVEQWRDRTDGNPFFLVELARLAAHSGRVADAVPASVQSVVRHRLGDLPEDVRELLLLAAAMGRQHPPLLLARVADLDADELLDRLEPAQEAGIIHSREGMLAFDHALTRDAVLAMTTPNRVARAHARIARTLEAAPPGSASPADRAFDLAHHWLAAGPLYAASAWPAAAAAGALAADEFANIEAAELFQAALDAHAVDPAWTAEDRYDLLLRFNESAARAGMWRESVAAVGAAVAVARALGDPGRVAAAVAALTRYGVWTPMEFGVVDHELVDDLRATLAQLDPGNSAERCTLMLALAAQLYYERGTHAEVEALVDEGMAMARRLGDTQLLAWSARTSSLALWRCQLLDRRRALAAEEVAAARASGDVAAEAVALAGVAGAALEAGDLETWESASAAALDIARLRRLSFVEFALRFVELSLADLRGGGDPATLADELRAVNGVRMSIPATEYIEFGIAYILAGSDPASARALADQMLGQDPDLADDLTRMPVLHLLAVAGQRQRLRQLLRAAPFPPHDWSESSDLATLALAAAVAGDVERSREVVARLSPLAGRMAVAGIAYLDGPVDCFLAIALAAAGNTAAARDAADRGAALAEEWRMTAFLDRFAEHRRRFGL